MYTVIILQLEIINHHVLINICYFLRDDENMLVYVMNENGKERTLT